MTNAQRQCPTPSRKRGRPPGSKNRKYFIDRDQALDVYQRTSSAPENAAFSRYQLFDTAAREIYDLNFKGSNFDANHKSEALARLVMMLSRYQERNDYEHYSRLMSLRDVYEAENAFLSSCVDESVGAFSCSLPQFEEWAESELVEIDYLYPVLPQGISRKVTRELFIEVSGVSRATRRRLEVRQD